MSVVTGAVVLTIIVTPLYREEILSLPLTAFAWFAILGLITFSLARFLYYTGVRFAGVTRAGTLSASRPFFATILALIFLREVPTLWSALGMLIIVSGIALVASEPAPVDHDPSSPGPPPRPLYGSAAALLAAFCFGIVHTTARHLVTQVTAPPVAVMFTFIFGAAGIALVHGRTLIKDRNAPRRGFVLMAVAGLGGTGGLSFLMMAFERAPIVIATSLAAITPLLVLPLAWLFLQRLERVTLRLWIGALLVVSGVMVLTLSR